MPAAELTASERAVASPVKAVTARRSPGAMTAEPHSFDPTEHRDWDRLYADAVALRLGDGEPAHRAELHAAVDVMGVPQGCWRDSRAGRRVGDLRPSGWAWLEQEH